MDNVTPIRPITGAQTPPAPSKPPRRRRSPPISDRAMELALDDQRKKLWEADAIIKSVALALEAHFGPAWSLDIPHFPMALRIASRLISDATGDLELQVLQDLAKRINVEERDGH